MTRLRSRPKCPACPVCPECPMCPECPKRTVCLSGPHFARHFKASRPRSELTPHIGCPSWVGPSQPVRTVLWGQEEASGASRPPAHGPGKHDHGDPREFWTDSAAHLPLPVSGRLLALVPCHRGEDTTGSPSHVHQGPTSPWNVWCVSLTASFPLRSVPSPGSLLGLASPLNHRPEEGSATAHGLCSPVSASQGTQGDPEGGRVKAEPLPGIHGSGTCEVWDVVSKEGETLTPTGSPFPGLLEWSFSQRRDDSVHLPLASKNSSSELSTESPSTFLRCQGAPPPGGGPPARGNTPVSPV